MTTSILGNQIIEPTIMVVVIGIFGFLIVLLVSTLRLSKAVKDFAAVSAIAPLQGDIRELEIAISRSQRELDQGLRAAVAEGMRQGLTAAFKHVQDGNLAHRAELATFGTALTDSLGRISQEAGLLSEKVATSLIEMRDVLSKRLAAAEQSAADGRVTLVRDTTGAILLAREQIEASMTVFGTQQESRLNLLDSSVKEGGATVQGILATFQKMVTEQVYLASQATEAALKSFGEQQGQRLDSVGRIVREGGEAAQLSLTGFRKELAERLDAMGKASSDLLEKSAATFGEIRSTMTASEEKLMLALSDQRMAVLERLTAGQLEVSEKLNLDLGTLVRGTSEKFDTFSERLKADQEQLRSLMGVKLEEMRSGNESKLEDMRKAVDEKLQSALEKQVGESFQRIAEQFAAVQQAIGQVQNVAGQVGDLRRLFSNVKSRGGWGEAQAEAMLQDMLPVGAYEKNMKFKEGSSEFVEFAIRVPGKDEAIRWIPVDSKFPTEDYERLLTANEQGNRDDEIAARNGLERRIRQEAERIGSKYIIAQKTVDFAILYLPSDSLFAEVARSPGLLELVRRNHKIIVMGPSLLPAFLHTVSVGYLTLAIEQNASQIGETLGAVKAEWGKLLPWLDKMWDRTESMKKGIEEVQRRARAVGRKLRTVDVLEHSRAEAVLGLDTPASDVGMDEIEETDVPA